MGIKTQIAVASAGMMLLLSPTMGCRAIARNAQSQPTIAARKLSRQGLEAMHQGDWQQAETLFSGALEQSQSDDRAQWGYAEALWQRGDQEMAVAHMERAVRLSGNAPELQLRLGRMYFDMGRISDAAQQADLSLGVNRNQAEGWSLRGDVLAASGKLEGALAAYHQALALQPKMPHAQMAAAEIYARRGRHDRVLATLDHLQDCVSQDACPCRAHVLRGVAFSELNRPDEARRSFALAASIQPDNTEILARWAESQWKSGDIDGARTTIARAMQIDSANESILAVAQLMNSASGERVAADPMRGPVVQPR